LKPAFLFFAVGVALLAQVGQPVPGQYPPGTYPPGQYPPGQYPPGQSGPPISIPRRGKKGDSNSDQKDAAAATKTFKGVIRVVEAKSFDMETEDTRILTIQITDKTVKPEELKMGDGVDVETTQDKDGQFQAVNIRVNAKVAQEINGSDSAESEGRTAPPPTIMVRPGPLHDADDAGPPKLKRGKPAARASSTKPDEDDDATPAAKSEKAAPEKPALERSAPATPPVNARRAFIEKARAAAIVYVEGLPNYVCQEVTTRYVSETRQPSWQVIDVISAEVVYENRKESYRNLTINGKPTKKAPEETGAWSSGEFGTILRNLFEPGTDADFRYAEDDTIARQPASVYKFEVERRRSSWKIWVPGQYILPAYKGSIWVDKQTANSLRIEMQAQEIPEEFPRIAVETAVDYDYITLGTPEKFLLPVRAEVLSCARGSNECERNVIEFRNYHKFTGESTIKFNQ
jgi:hypothetical protein